MEKDIEKELKKSFKNSIKMIPPFAWLLLPCVFCLCVFFYSLSIRLGVKSTGNSLGNGMGAVVGRAIGSVEGFTVGVKEGYEAGKETGLSATLDNTADISSKFEEMSRLDVLVASGTFSDILSIGNDPVQYAAILSTKYNAIFWVDLKNAEIVLTDTDINIFIDEPTLDFIPIGDVEKLNEYEHSKFFNNGSADAGYEAANNSMNNLPKVAEKSLLENDSLVSSARAAAEKQIVQLVDSVQITTRNVTVKFREVK